MNGSEKEIMIFGRKALKGGEEAVEVTEAESKSPKFWSYQAQLTPAFESARQICTMSHSSRITFQASIHSVYDKPLHLTLNLCERRITDLTC